MQFLSCSVQLTRGTLGVRSQQGSALWISLSGITNWCLSDLAAWQSCPVEGLTLGYPAYLLKRQDDALEAAAI